MIMQNFIELTAVATGRTVNMQQIAARLIAQHKVYVAINTKLKIHFNTAFSQLNVHPYAEYLL